MCHKPADLARRVGSAADRDTGRAATATFLAHHGRADAAADAAIIDWLLDGARNDGDRRKQPRRTVGRSSAAGGARG
jgi:hypothetical protein